MLRIGLDTDQPGVRFSRTAWWLTAVTMIFAIGLLAFGGLTILDSKTATWHQATRVSDQLVRVLTRELARAFSAQDLALQAVIAARGRSDIDRIGSDAREAALAGMGVRGEATGSLIVVNPKGDVVASSPATRLAGITVASQEFFKVHQDHADAGLFIGQPFPNPMRNGEVSIAISRRLTRSDGDFNGVAASVVPLSWLSDLFGDLGLAETASVMLVRSDGQVAVRFPIPAGDTDNDLSKTPVFHSYAAGDAGYLVGTGSADAIDRLYSFRHLPELPLILSVGIAVQEIEADWLRNALIHGTILVLFGVATIGLCLWLRRENRGRMVAEAVLRDAAVQKAISSGADGLTGLTSRKLFDERLGREWNRSIRAGTPIALVLLDTDRFKGFNDRYGHSEGDLVLRAIADCIARCAQRPGDTNARFAGEEFAVLLPETDMTGAAIVAERIREAVEALAIPYEGSAAGRVTVSVGVTMARPVAGEKQGSLVARADIALTAAKAAGRNMIGRSAADGTVAVGEMPLFVQPRFYTAASV